MIWSVDLSVVPVFQLFQVCVLLERFLSIHNKVSFNAKQFSPQLHAAHQEFSCTVFDRNFCRHSTSPRGSVSLLHPQIIYTVKSLFLSLFSSCRKWTFCSFLCTWFSYKCIAYRDGAECRLAEKMLWLNSYYKLAQNWQGLFELVLIVAIKIQIVP